MTKNNIVEFNADYKTWISEVGRRYKNSQIKAAVKVNSEMLHFYWHLGREMVVLKEQVSWGITFINK